MAGASDTAPVREDSFAFEVYSSRGARDATGEDEAK